MLKVSGWLSQMMIVCQNRIGWVLLSPAGSALAPEGAIHPVGDPNRIWLILWILVVDILGTILLLSDRCLKKLEDLTPDFPIGGYDDVDLPITPFPSPTSLLYLMPVFSNAIKFIKKRNNWNSQNMMAWAYHVNKKIDKLWLSQAIQCHNFCISII